MQPSSDIKRLLDIMAALRTPESGCGWDIAQTFETIVPYTIEEAYEIADAVARGDMADLRDELGDLLLQVVFQARIAEEKGAFDFGGVVEAITQKMIRRHPHVFGDARDLAPGEVEALWARIKAEEKSAKASAPDSARHEATSAGLLHDVILALPGLSRAVKLQNKASSVGFDWNDIRAVLDKIREETNEIEDVLEGGDQNALEDEIGDLLFAVANLARHAKIDPESAVRRANAKFERRFGFIERELASQGVALGNATLAEMDSLWNAAKARESVDPEFAGKSPAGG
ncbi:nucleoside triphosphate pyrophosphohydrolase [Methylocella tundrae]|uniref:Nucleoside triphosphate pyrophosphohydrolase n=1 Tax=Methylocella tundrae TaxID=227605 RepID=A0A4U8YW11_METTU|nr:nucleoside triphosphate pyrophosphohydrolase [Methylocella tundrae]WPP05577.1 nucleoside triphosphate pyrophosphohydrolase [Methylocella tundrae]VFU08020.1 Nucleoside triphosphate pyrophosphohydrolase [Methylocella tundrae]